MSARFGCTTGWYRCALGPTATGGTPGSWRTSPLPRRVRSRSPGGRGRPDGSARTPVCGGQCRRGPGRPWPSPRIREELSPGGGPGGPPERGQRRPIVLAAAGSIFIFLLSHMSEPHKADIRTHLDAVFRGEAGRILATLIRLLGNFDVAEDAMHDAFNAALQRWPTEGIPANPRAWLISTARFKAIDAMRRRIRLDASRDDIAATLHGGEPAPSTGNDELPDDRLRLIFTCCHPVLAADARGPHPARGVRAHHGRDRERIPHLGADDRPADCPREGEDPRRAHPLSGALRDGASGAGGCGARGGIPSLQRGLLGIVGTLAHARRAVGRGHSPRAHIA